LLPLAGGAQSDDCLQCHEDPDMTMERDGAEVSLYYDAEAFAASVHEGMDCADCHDGFDAWEMPHRAEATPVDCISCHSDLGASHGFHPQIAELEAVDRTPGSYCADCHGAHDVVAVDSEDFAFAPDRINGNCSECHTHEGAVFSASAHAGAPGGPFPDCLSCHDRDVVNGTMSLLERKTAQLEICLSCHVDSPEAAQRTRLAGKFVADWSSSVHARALEAGNEHSANCVDCHGSHEMARAMVADSRVNKLHIQETCQTCHAAESEAYGLGAHALALSRGIMDAPVCTDCHGEHLILGAHDPNARVSPRNVSQQLCGECHGSVRLSEKYGIQSDRFSTFADSYHGLSVRGGAVEVVNCASCHGAHDILPSYDPRSPIHRNNLAKTCGECHRGANDRFAVGKVHVSLEPGQRGGEDGQWIIQLIATLYFWAIVLIVGGMVLHNLLDFIKKVRRKVHGHVHGIAEEPLPHRLYLRMTVNERLQHATMAISFIVLVITGFMLRFPDAWWVVGLRNLNSHIFELRSLLHRIAGVVMLLAGFWHLAYVVFTHRGRQLVCDLWPRLADMTDAIGVLRYNLGLAKSKPRFGRFSYIEKAEYWALIWGSIIMTATGFLLWFDETTMGLFTKLGFDISRVIHYYEAILATLAIIVWHFYAVIFNPDVYPMNLSWLTGYLSEEEMAEEHPAELERLRRIAEEEGGAAGRGRHGPTNPH